ncbi:hypothetical protein GCM10010425_54140 [Streptomyces spororaveus]|uniref:Uncharacterized protein n=1 Tax=Streptomyces spororaveus TaxID=284039 RepID=A0ABQ3T3T3_9ACTN|nr:hypothetical protein Sspor_06070 [Streptomyces spororaveus]
MFTASGGTLPPASVNRAEVGLPRQLRAFAVDESVVKVERPERSEVWAATRDSPCTAGQLEYDSR